MVWRDSVGVEGSRSGLKSERADILHHFSLKWCEPRTYKGKFAVFCILTFLSDKSENGVEFGDKWVE